RAAIAEQPIQPRSRYLRGRPGLRPARRRGLYPAAGIAPPPRREAGSAIAGGFLPRYAGEVASDASRRGRQQHVPLANMPPPPCSALSPSPAEQGRSRLLSIRAFVLFEPAQHDAVEGLRRLDIGEMLHAGDLFVACARHE